MAKIVDLKDLLVWQKAHQLVLKVYKYIIALPIEEKYGLTSQIRRCAVSVPSNIAEGFRRRGRDKFQFYSYSQGSLEELKYQILLCYELKYIDDVKCIDVINLCDEVGKMLNGWIKKLK